VIPYKKNSAQPILKWNSTIEPNRRVVRLMYGSKQMHENEMCRKIFDSLEVQSAESRRDRTFHLFLFLLQNNMKEHNIFSRNKKLGLTYENDLTLIFDP